MSHAPDPTHPLLVSPKHAAWQRNRKYDEASLRFSLSDAETELYNDWRDWSYLRIVFTWNASVLPAVWPKLVVSVLWSVLISFGDNFLKETSIRYGGIEIGEAVFSLIGLAIGFLLVFRTNISYQRYEESRGYFSQLTKCARCFSRRVLSIGMLSTAENAAAAINIARLNVVFMQLIGQHLHREFNLEPDSSIHALLTKRELMFLANGMPVSKESSGGPDIKHYQLPHRRPLAALYWIQESVSTLRMKKLLSETEMKAFGKKMDELSEVFNCLDKIRSTAVPLPYVQLVEVLLVVYVFAVPCTLVKHFGFMTFVPELFVAFAFFGINAISQEIQDPFGRDPNDLPLDQFIDTSAKDIGMYCSMKYGLDGDLFTINSSTNLHKLLAVGGMDSCFDIAQHNDGNNSSHSVPNRNSTSNAVPHNADRNSNVITGERYTIHGSLPAFYGNINV